ncbi:MAG: extracellular solute-binding protein, partial [Treponema sp.]|nr:extracellular solute-binding protein [Treponema sp.]
MKKLLKVGMLAALSASMIFTSCSQKEAAKPADPNAPVTLTVWCWDPNFNIYAMNTAAEIYKKDHPNVTVNVVETPWADMQQKLATSLNAGATDTLPDIILMQDNATQRYVINYPKAFLPLDGKVDVSQFAGYKVMDGTVDGKHYSVPFDNGVTGTFLNMDIIEAAGLKLEDFEDITWDRFIELGKIVKEKTGKGLIGTQQGSSDMLMVMLQSAGSWFFDANGKITMKDNPVLKETLATYKKMVE